MINIRLIKLSYAGEITLRSHFHGAIVFNYLAFLFSLATNGFRRIPKPIPTFVSGAVLSLACTLYRTQPPGEWIKSNYFHLTCRSMRVCVHECMCRRTCHLATCESETEREGAAAHIRFGQNSFDRMAVVLCTHTTITTTPTNTAKGGADGREGNRAPHRTEKEETISPNQYEFYF